MNIEFEHLEVQGRKQGHYVARSVEWKSKPKVLSPNASTSGRRFIFALNFTDHPASEEKS